MSLPPSFWTTHGAWHAARRSISLEAVLTFSFILQCLCNEIAGTFVISVDVSFPPWKYGFFKQPLFDSLFWSCYDSGLNFDWGSHVCIFVLQQCFKDDILMFLTPLHQLLDRWLFFCLFAGVIYTWWNLNDKNHSWDNALRYAWKKIFTCERNWSYVGEIGRLVAFLSEWWSVFHWFVSW